MCKNPSFRTPFDTQQVKHSVKLHGSSFIRLFGHFGKNWVRKCTFYSYLKSSDCLLTYWLPISSIIFAISLLFLNWFKCNYIGNNNFYLNFLPNIWNLHQILNIFKTKITPKGYVFSKLDTTEEIVTWMSKKHSSTISLLNSAKNHTAALSSYCFITLGWITLENVGLNDIWNLRTVC